MGDNAALSVKDIREKCIVLLAFTAMVRPSDIAPKVVIFDKNAISIHKFVFSVNKLHFEQNGSVIIYFHGTKNDIDRSEFFVCVNPTSDPLLDLVSAFKSYINKTSEQRDQTIDKPVFLTWTKPYRAIDSNTICYIETCLRARWSTGRKFPPKRFPSNRSHKSC